jgi:DTW domain-containing protein YfiP
VNSETTARFWKAFYALPEEVQIQAREAYRLFRANPYHPSLQFSCKAQKISLYAARVNIGYRALGTVQNDLIVWFWIGDHDEYERLIKLLQR